MEKKREKESKKKLNSSGFKRKNKKSNWNAIGNDQIVLNSRAVVVVCLLFASCYCIECNVYYVYILFYLCYISWFNVSCWSRRDSTEQCLFSIFVRICRVCLYACVFLCCHKINMHLFFFSLQFSDFHFINSKFLFYSSLILMF